MTKSFFVMKIPIEADFQRQKAYTDLVQSFAKSQGMVFKRKQILEDRAVSQVLQYVHVLGIPWNTAFRSGRANS